VGKRWLISAVARIYKPGCKVDHSLILEGPQGVFKSTGLRFLFTPWFTDALSEIGSKDSALELRGVWLIELAELDMLARAEVSKIKAYMSRMIDRFRPPYGRVPVSYPRECVFAGTVNNSTYLRDETGGRRFWPVKCGPIDLKGLERDRDQLWVEARDAYHSGARWWLEGKEVIQAATAEQEERYDSDAWHDLMLEWLIGKDTVTITEVLTECLRKARDHWTQTDQNRVSRTLRALKWERFRLPRSSVNDSRQWAYRLAFPVLIAFMLASIDSLLF